MIQKIRGNWRNAHVESGHQNIFEQTKYLPDHWIVAIFNESKKTNLLRAKVFPSQQISEIDSIKLWTDHWNISPIWWTPTWLRNSQSGLKLTFDGFKARCNRARYVKLWFDSCQRQMGLISIGLWKHLFNLSSFWQPSKSEPNTAGSIKPGFETIKRQFEPTMTVPQPCQSSSDGAHIYRAWKHLFNLSWLWQLSNQSPSQRARSHRASKP